MAEHMPVIPEEWHPPRFPLQLQPYQVHIWRASLDVPREQVAHFARLLSADETERARRFVFDSDRRRYTVARGILRTLLGAYLGIDAAALTFAYGPEGKPSLCSIPPETHGATAHSPLLFFNISHSRDLAVFALTRAGRIGIDVEYRRSLDTLSTLAAGVFSRSELAVFRSLPKSEQLAAFYNGWTRKEAFVKAIGDGLAYPLRRFDVSLAPGQPARLLRLHGEPDAHRRWQMAEFSPSINYAGAVVVEAAAVEFVYQDFTLQGVAT